VALCQCVCVCISCHFERSQCYNLHGNAVQNINALWSSECQQLLTQWCSVTSQKTWIFQLQTIVQAHWFYLKINLRIGPLNPMFLLWPEHRPIEMPTTRQLSPFTQKLYTFNGTELSHLPVKVKYESGITCTFLTNLMSLPLGKSKTNYGVSQHVGWWRDLFHKKTLRAVYG